MNQPHSINLVRKFHEAFGHPIADEHTPATKALRKLRVQLIAEELVEYAAALGVRLDVHYDPTVHGTSDDASVVVQPVVDDDRVDLVEAADALGDLDYVVQGANLIHGFPAEKVINEIQRANMSKLGADGKPIYREDGKVMKGPNYTPPDIATVLKYDRESRAELQKFESSIDDGSAIRP